MNANKGYAVWPTSDGSVSFTGTLQSGNVNVSVVRTGYGWNCIGNPYTSAIAINSAASATNNFIDINQSDPSKFANSYEAIYVWNQNAGSYDIVNHGYTGGAYYIPVGQAFFVRAASADLFSFTPAMQSHQNGAPFKSASVEWPTISINATANAKSSKALVKFNPEMSRGLDVGYDAGVMKTGFEVYTRLVEDNGVDFGLQCLPLVESEGMVIPVGIESTETGAVSLLVTASNLPEGFVAMLEDRQRGTILPVTDEGVTLEVAEGGTQANRFFLHVGSVTNVGRVSDWGKRITVLQGNGKLKVSGIDIRGCTATLYDVQGRKLLTSKLDIDTVISTEGFINGIYLLEVKQQGNVITKRVAVKN